MQKRELLEILKRLKSEIVIYAEEFTFNVERSRYLVSGELVSEFILKNQEII